MPKSHRPIKKAARDKKRACGQFILHILYIILDRAKSFLLKEKIVTRRLLILLIRPKSHNLGEFIGFFKKKGIILVDGERKNC